MLRDQPDLSVAPTSAIEPGLNNARSELVLSLALTEKFVIPARLRTAVGALFRTRL
ncbi:hypothetical protein GCM10027097_44140 [Amycolatopsis acidiphila]